MTPNDAPGLLLLFVCDAETSTIGRNAELNEIITIIIIIITIIILILTSVLNHTINGLCGLRL